MIAFDLRCAKEGDTCHCDGEITYAPELFDGFVYTVPSAERSYKVVSNGAWHCGTDQNGDPFRTDPAPWRVKHCWCTPNGILEILKKHDDSSLHKKECSEAANFDFEQAATRRLGEQSDDFSVEDGADEDEEEEQQQEEEEVLDEEDSYGKQQALARRLKTDTRRRRTYNYVPWALVSVPKEDSFDLDGSGSGKQISCAYEYGVPVASAQLYQSDGAYAGDVWKVEAVAKKWGSEGSASSRPCWVRARGEAGERLAACAVALDKPGELQEKAKGSISLLWKLLWIFLVVAVIGTGLFVVGGFLVWQDYSASRGRGGQERLMTNG